ncbi:AraC family transcriptional regulator [Paracoccus sp. MBLB3053]|uniref:AraC family transcriptional regulator n=1 Tax=Paracoccus aurantius TaxID=3073814 RepID=A0ABU2HX18_9RHOB|nr:AraC family transcriptional regulator [Paracoccus sp. MBLB3053]MDS9469588.1 AraC family transcriptional regulator [Paracoccus sp. MBLB3053]
MAQLILLEGGSIQLQEQSRQLSGGQMAWLPVGRRKLLRIEAGSHSVGLSLTQSELARIVLQAEAGGRFAPLTRMTLIASLPAARQGRIALLFEDIATELAEARPDRGLMAEAACTLLLVNFLRLVQSDPTQMTRQLPLAERFKLLAGQHLHEHWTVNAYAEALSVTRFQLNSAMRRQTRRSPQDYLHDELIGRAKMLLTGTPLRVADIAYRLGYQDPAYFCRVFHRRVGQPPGAWRMAQDGGPPSFAAWP